MKWCLCAGSLFALYVGINASALDLGAQQVHRDLAGQVYHLRDDQGALDVQAALRRYDSGEFAPVTTPNIDFGFSYAAHWLVLPLINSSSAEQKRIVSFNMRFMQTLQAYFRVGDELRLVLDNDRNSPFDARPVAHRHLAVPLTIPGSSEGELIVRYWSEGTTALPISLESEVSFARLDGFHTAKNAAFYAFVGFMLIYAVIFGAANRSAVIASYGFYLLCVALYMVHMDGYAFVYLWPDLPRWNAGAALPLGLLLNVGAVVFTISFLSTYTRYPRMHRLLVGIIVLCITWSALGSWLAPSQSKQFAFPFTFVCALLFLGLGIRAYRDGQRSALFYVIGWTGLTGAALFTTFSHWSAGELVVGSSFEIIRIGVLIDATMMALAVLSQFNELRQLRNQAMVDKAHAAEEVLGLQHRFFDLEERYRDAFALAEQRSHQLAAASHDLRQPLAAMRMAMRSLSGESSERQLMTDALQYLESLLNGYITSVTRSADGDSDGAQPAASMMETVPAHAVLDNLSAMFGGVAVRQGIRLKVVRSSMLLDGDAIVLLRILNNLVDNAIKHSGASRIVAGFRRGLHGGSFLVMDDGIGFHANREEPAEGFGLGLDIVSSLCARNGYRFEVHNNRSKGACAVVVLANRH